jgi:hypothetical protein
MKEKKETVKRTERDAKLHRQIEKRSKKEVKDSEHNNKKKKNCGISLWLE